MLCSNPGGFKLFGSVAGWEGRCPPVAKMRGEGGVPQQPVDGGGVPQWLISGRNADGTAEVAVAVPTAEYPQGHPNYPQGYVYPYWKLMHVSTFLPQCKRACFDPEIAISK